jgi:multidrug efflux pump subunit AcrB
MNIGALGEEVTAIKVALRRASRTRLLMLLLVLVFLAVAIWMFYGLGKQFASEENLDRLAAKANERINQSSGPAMKQLQGLVDHCTPVLTKAFSEQAQADMPKYTKALEEQRELLVRNLESRLGDRVTARTEAVGDRFEAILQEEFPQVDDSELIVQLYASIEQILEKLVAKYYSDQIRQEVEGVVDTWNDFEMAEVPAEGETPLEQEFLAELMLLGHYRFKGQALLIPTRE